MGFTLTKSLSSADHDGKLQTYSVSATHATLLAPGDVVVITGDADTMGVATADAAAPGDPLGSKAIAGDAAQRVEPIGRRCRLRVVV